MIFCGVIELSKSQCDVKLCVLNFVYSEFQYLSITDLFDLCIML